MGRPRQQLEDDLPLPKKWAAQRERMESYAKAYGGGWFSKDPVTVLNMIRDDYGIGTSAEYEFVTEEKFFALAKETGYLISHGHKSGGTLFGFHSSQKKKPIVFISNEVISQDLSGREDAPSNVSRILSVMRHEYEHVKQKNSPDYPSKYRPEKYAEFRQELAEFEAYLSEIDHAVSYDRRGSTETSQQAIYEAVCSARKHFQYLSQNEKDRYKNYDKLLGKMFNEMQAPIASPVDIVRTLLERFNIPKLVKT